MLIGTTLLAGSLYAMDSTGVEVSFSGYIDADMAGTVIKGSKVNYESNQEVDLTASVKYNDKVSVDLFITNLSGNVPAGGGGPRWNELAFDGAVVNWALDGMGTLMVGDMVMSGGAFNYYFYKRTVRYAAVLKETYTRGLGMDFDFGTSVYVGSSDLGVNYADFFLAHSLETDAFMVRPFFWALLGEGDVMMRPGVDFSVKAGELAVSGAVGALMDPDKDPTINFLVEPSMSMGDISIAASVYYSMQADAIADRSGFGFASITDPALVASNGVTEEYFVYIEPGMSFNDHFAAGLPLEYHGGEKDADSETFAIVPTLYFYPTTDVEFWLWGGMSLPMGDINDGDDPTYAFGSEIIANF